MKAQPPADTLNQRPKLMLMDTTTPINPSKRVAWQVNNDKEPNKKFKSTTSCEKYNEDQVVLVKHVQNKVIKDTDSYNSTGRTESKQLPYGKTIEAVPVDQEVFAKPIKIKIIDQTDVIFKTDTIDLIEAKVVNKNSSSFAIIKTSVGDFILQSTYIPIGTQFFIKIEKDNQIDKDKTLKFLKSLVAFSKASKVSAELVKEFEDIRGNFDQGCGNSCFPKLEYDGYNYKLTVKGNKKIDKCLNFSIELKDLLILQGTIKFLDNNQIQYFDLIVKYKDLTHRAEQDISQIFLTKQSGYKGIIRFEDYGV